MTSTEVWIALLSGLFAGGGLKTLLDMLKEYIRGKKEEREQVAEHQRQISQQPIDNYQSLVHDLTTRVVTMEAAHKDCTEHHAECQRQVGELTGRLDELRQQVQMLNPSPVNILVEQRAEEVKNVKRS